MEISYAEKSKDSKQNGAVYYIFENERGKVELGTSLETLAGKGLILQ